MTQRESATGAKAAVLAVLSILFVVPGDVLAGGGGPDAFGYTWVDTSPVVGGCSYSFTDISATGTVIGTGDDSVFTAIPIGFNFTYYGAVYTTVNVSTNGYLVFNTTGNSFSNTCPMPVTLNDLQVSPFWDDLYVFAPSTLRYQTVGTAPNRTFIVQWNNVGFCCSTPPPGLTFQAQFREGSNIIAFMYSDVQANSRTQGDSATIGIDGPGTTNFLQTSCNTVTTLVNGYARFFLPPGVLSCLPQVASTTAVSSSWNPSILGGTVIFTAQVTGSTGPPPTPTGTVTFVIDGVPEATIPLDGSAVAAYATSALVAGSHTVVAQYSGDASFEPSESGILTQVVLTVQEIPTLSTLGLAGFGLVLLAAGFALVRRRRSDLAR